MNEHHSIRLDALKSLDWALARFSPAGVMTYANDAGLSLLGVAAGERVELSMLFPDPAERQRIAMQLAERLSGKAAAYETEFHRPHSGIGAAPVPISVFALPDTNEEGAVTGSITLLRDLREERVRAGIHKAIEISRTNKALFARLIEQLRALFTFDEFRVTIVSQSRRHLGRMYSDDPEAATKYPFRWWPMPPFILEELDHRKPEILTINEMRKDPHYQALMVRDAACRHFFESGVHQILSVPVQRGNRIVAFINLDARQENCFNDAALQLFMRLPVCDAVSAAIQREQRQEHKSVLKLMRQIGRITNDVYAVANTLVKRLQTTFNWDHVSIFQAELNATSVRLLCQAAAPGVRSLPAQFEIQTAAAPDSEQEQRGRAVVKAATTLDVVNVSDSRHMGLFPPGADTREGSGVAVPIPGEGLRWVLNVESRLGNAFATEEVELLKMLASQAGEILRRSAMLELQLAVLKAIDNAVIETDRSGHIRSINKAGEHLLGLAQTECARRNLLELLYDEHVRADWRVTEKADPTEVVLQRDDGRHVTVLLSVSPLPTHLAGRVYVASDLTMKKEAQRLQELKVVFQQAAMEGRIPLSLAGAALQQYAREVPDARGLVEKVSAQLVRADLPLERLMRLFSAEHRILAHPYADFGQALELAIFDLPGYLAEHITRDAVDIPFPVEIGFEDLQFCIESMLAFGLRTRPQSGRLRVALTQRSSKVHFTVAGDWLPRLDVGQNPAATERWRRTSMSDLTLGHTVINRIIVHAKGLFRFDFDRQLSMEIELPLFD